MKSPKLAMNKIQVITSKNGIKMVIGHDLEGYAVFTAEEWSQGKDFRYPEFDGIDGIEEARSQAKHY